MTWGTRGILWSVSRIDPSTQYLSFQAHTSSARKGEFLNRTRENPPANVPIREKLLWLVVAGVVVVVCIVVASFLISYILTHSAPVYP